MHAEHIVLEPRAARRFLVSVTGLSQGPRSGALLYVQCKRLFMTLVIRTQIAIPKIGRGIDVRSQGEGRGGGRGRGGGEGRGGRVKH